MEVVMKANEAPEKIYLPYKDDRLVGLVKTEGVKFNSGVDGHIEYTRTDAFIDKACEWLEKNGCGYWLDDSALPNRDLIDEFRKYMKGE